MPFEHDIRIDIHKQHTECDRDQQKWLEPMSNCQEQEKTCNRDHDQIAPGEAEESGLMHEIS